MLKVGQEGFFYKYVTERDVKIFAEVSGDKNPLHLDEEYAKGTRFHGRIAHGMIGAGFISAAIAGVLPGPGTVYLSQMLNFERPVRIGDVYKRQELVDLAVQLSLFRLIGSEAEVRPAPIPEQSH